MIDTGATPVGLASDHVIESFRDDPWLAEVVGACQELARVRLGCNFSRLRRVQHT